MKLKWYDWDGEGEIPPYVKGVRLRGGIERIPVSSIYSLGCMWKINKDDFDIIAYTLGEQVEYCDGCHGDNFVAVTCCGGHECGCMGQPIDFEPCGKCNSDGSKDADTDLKKAFPFFFGEPLEGGE